MSRKNIFIIVLLTAGAALVAEKAPAQTWTQLLVGTHNWDDNANWGGNPFPNLQDAAANMNVNITGNQTVNLNQAITVGSLALGDSDNTESFTIAPNGGTLTFDVSAGNAALTKAASTSTTIIDTITAPVILNDNLDITNSSAFYFTAGAPQGMVRLSGGVSDGGAGAKGINKGGPGTVSITGGTTNTYTGPTNVTQGTLLVESVSNTIPDASPINIIATGAGTEAVVRWGLFNQYTGRSDVIGPLTMGGTTTTSRAYINMGFQGTLFLSGDVTYDATNNPLGAIMGVSGMSVGTISLSGATRTFNVGDSSSDANDLSVNQFITNGSIIKDGFGRLSFGTSNGLTNVWVKRGQAFAFQPGGMSASVLIGDSSGSDDVYVHMERGGNTNVVVAGGNTGNALLTGRFGVGSGSQAMSGTIQLGDGNGPHDLTIGGLSHTPTYTGNISGNGNLTLDGSSTQLRMHQSSINHAGTLSAIGAGTVDINAAIGANVTGVTSSSATLTLDGANTYLGSTTVTGGTTTLTGSLANSNILVDGGTFQGGSGTLLFNINGASSDLIDLDSGTLNITTMTIDFEETGLGATETSYVIVDYLDGGAFLHNGDPNFFQTVVDLPFNYAFFDDVANSQLLIVQAIPEPGAFALALLGLAGFGGLIWRRSQVYRT